MSATRTKLPLAIIIALAMMLSTVLLHASAVPAAARTNNSTKPVLFIHGYSGANCESDWGTLLNNMRANGWSGPFYILKFTAGDAHCNPRTNVHMAPMYNYGSHSHWYGHSGTTHTNNTSIRHLSWHLANYIYSVFSSKGIYVDVVAHSMGGLLIRYALAKQGWDSFPYLRVEDVVTLGTPHGGSTISSLTGTTQGNEMLSGSSLIQWMSANAKNPQGIGGTDWTNIGSHGDWIVSATSATATSAAHRWRYSVYPTAITHEQYMRLSGSGQTRQASYPCSSGWCVTNTYWPINMIRMALYYGSW